MIDPKSHLHMEQTDYGQAGQRSAEKQAQSALDIVLQFRNKLLRIEREHAFLRHDLSSVCDDFIARFNQQLTLQDLPVEYIDTSKDEPAVEQIAPCQIESAAEPVAPLSIDNPAQKTAQLQSNTVISALNKAGHHIESGLDKAGDGIIFCFEALLKLGNGKAPGRFPGPGE